MSSLSTYLTPRDLYLQIRMERQNHKGVFFLMEGATDFRRFEKFVDRSQVSVVVCNGKKNVFDTIELMQDEGKEDCLGFADCDFDAIDKCTKVNSDVVCSLNHDFDLDVCLTDVASRYLNEVGDGAKVAAEGGVQAFVESILSALKPLSALRYANHKGKLKYSLSNLKLDDFFDGWNIDISKMIDCASTGRFNSQQHKDDLKKEIDLYAGRNFNLSHFTNGHDFIAAIGIALRDRVGNRLHPQTWRDEVEKHIRLAFNHSDFKQIGLEGKIRTWQSAREGADLLRPI